MVMSVSLLFYELCFDACLLAVPGLLLPARHIQGSRLWGSCSTQRGLSQVGGREVREKSDAHYLRGYLVIQ